MIIRFHIGFIVEIISPSYLDMRVRSNHANVRFVVQITFMDLLMDAAWCIVRDIIPETES
ncbi:MAG TPA: hypothetical protein VGZ71_11230 [Puia sp.]|jgi:hypothetical protein|nr:hypothetical protein [Puia sp.]